MSRIFAVQNQLHRDPQTMELVPKFDLSGALEHGDEIIYLLGSNVPPWTPDRFLDDLHRKLADFCDDDHLLLVGNPVLMSICFAIAADYNDGRVKVLQWSGKDQRYMPILVDGVFRAVGNSI